MDQRMFRHAIVRSPGATIIDGLTGASLGKPEYKKAQEQHSAYIEAIRKSGLDITVLNADDRYPDSTFIEDVALCTSGFAVITRPGAESRRGETDGIRNILQDYFEKIEEITLPGTLEAGDVMMAGNHFFIGISGRTNDEGARQLIKILERHGMTGSTIALKNLLHLKSGCSYLENNNILVCEELSNCSDLGSFNRIIVDPEENYAANSLWINDTVFIPAGYPGTKQKVENWGYRTFVLDVSEFRKVDGGLSCLSLRF